MVRHQNLKHQCFKIVSMLLDSLLSIVVEGVTEDVSDAIPAIIDAAPAIKIYEFERNRNERVAAFRAEFEQRFPSFAEEVRSLKVAKTTLPRKKKQPMLSTPALARRSGRFQGQVQESSNLVSPVLVELEVLEDVMEPGLVEEQDETTVSDMTEDLDDESAEVLVEDLDEFGVPDDSVKNGGDTEVHVVDVEESTPGDLVTGEGEAGDEFDLGKHACLPCGMAFR